MTVPRLVDDPTLAPFERELLDAYRPRPLTEEDKAAVWQGIVRAAPAAAAATTSLSWSARLARGLSKVSARIGTRAFVSIACTLTVGSVLVGLHFATPAASAPPGPAPRAPVEPPGSTSPAPVEEGPRGVSVDELPSAPRVTSPSATSAPPSSGPPAQASAPDPAPVTPPERLVEEARRLRAARQALSSGDTATAQRLLDERDFSLLVEERDVIQIDVLVARGEGASARRAAARFVAEHPRSPHADRLRQSVIR